MGTNEKCFTRLSTRPTQLVPTLRVGTHRRRSAARLDHMASAERTDQTVTRSVRSRVPTPSVGTRPTLLGFGQRVEKRLEVAGGGEDRVALVAAIEGMIDQAIGDRAGESPQEGSLNAGQREGNGKKN